MCRRFFDGGNLWNLNSFNVYPETVDDDLEFLDALALNGADISLIVIPKDHFLANHNNLKFRHVLKPQNLQTDPFPEPIRQQLNQIAPSSQNSEYLEVLESTQPNNNRIPPSTTDVSLQLNPMGYHHDLLSHVHNNVRYIYGSKQEICNNLNLRLFDVPNDGHCFLHCVQKFFNDVFGTDITIDHLFGKALNILSSDTDLLGRYRESYFN